MKAWVVAREMPGKPDSVLRKIDGIQLGIVHEYNHENLIEIADELEEEFYTLNPEKRNWFLTIESDIDSGGTIGAD